MIISHRSLAQTSSGAQYGIVLGGGVSSAVFSETNNKNSDSFAHKSNLIPVFNAGIFASIPFNNSFAIQPQIIINQKGLQSKNWLFDSDINYKLTSWFLELPVQIQYRYHLDKCILIGFVEPYIGYCILNKLKYYDSIGDVVLDRNDFVSSKEEHMEPFEYGTGIGASILFDRFGVSISNIWNLNSIGNNDNDDYPGINKTLKNANFYGISVSLSYLF